MSISLGRAPVSSHRNLTHEMNETLFVDDKALEVSKRPINKAINEAADLVASGLALAGGVTLGVPQAPHSSSSSRIGIR